MTKRPGNMTGESMCLHFDEVLCCCPLFWVSHCGGMGRMAHLWNGTWNGNAWWMMMCAGEG